MEEMPTVISAVNAINLQTLTYLPSVVAGVQAIEAVAPDASGAAKLEALLAATTGALALTPNPNVAAISAMASMFVQIFHLLGAGAFRKKEKV